jgi:hypothetical protein
MGAILLHLIHVLTCATQFKEQFLLSKDLDTQDSLQFKKPKRGLRALLRELSDNDDDAVTKNTGPNIPEDPFWPWLRRFQVYLNAVEQVPDGWSAVKWWGVHQQKGQ